MLTIPEEAIAHALQIGRTLDNIISDVNFEMKDKIRKFSEYCGASGLSDYVASRQDTRTLAEQLRDNPRKFEAFKAKCLSEGINIAPIVNKLPGS